MYRAEPMKKAGLVPARFKPVGGLVFLFELSVDHIVATVV